MAFLSSAASTGAWMMIVAWSSKASMGASAAAAPSKSPLASSASMPSRALRPALMPAMACFASSAEYFFGAAPAASGINGALRQAATPMARRVTPKPSQARMKSRMIAAAFIAASGGVSDAQTRRTPRNRSIAPSTRFNNACNMH